MALTGELFIASKRVRRDGEGFRAVAAATGQEIEPAFSLATTDDVDAAVAAAIELLVRSVETDLRVGIALDPPHESIFVSRAKHGTIVIHHRWESIGIADRGHTNS